MVRVKLEASSRFTMKIHDPNYTTTENDIPPEEVVIPGYPSVGDDISNPITGQTWTVVRVGWMINEEAPIVVVE